MWKRPRWIKHQQLGTTNKFSVETSAREHVVQNYLLSSDLDNVYEHSYKFIEKVFEVVEFTRPNLALGLEFNNHPRLDSFLWIETKTNQKYSIINLVKIR